MNIGKDANGGMRKLSWEPPKMQTCGRSAENTSRLHLRDGEGVSQLGAWHSCMTWESLWKVGDARFLWAGPAGLGSKTHILFGLLASKRKSASFQAHSLTCISINAKRPKECWEPWLCSQDNPNPRLAVHTLLTVAHRAPHDSPLVTFPALPLTTHRRLQPCWVVSRSLTVHTCYSLCQKHSSSSFLPD